MLTSSSLKLNPSPLEDPTRLASLDADDCLLPVLADPAVREIEGNIVLLPLPHWVSLLKVTTIFDKNGKTHIPALSVGIYKSGWLCYSQIVR